jgi:tricorn protease
MLKTLGSSFLLLAVSATAATGAEPLKFARFPAPSPHGKRVAFVYQGDLWVAPMEGGTARRITIHPAYDAHPIWSPDGHRIAFRSLRNGNADVYVIGVDGGSVRRLTFHSSSDTPRGWSRDGNTVLFTSDRPCRCFLRPLLFAVSVEGGMPYRVTGAEMREPTPSPDGRLLAFVRGAVRWSRRGYRGSAEMKL